MKKPIPEHQSPARIAAATIKSMVPRDRPPNSFTTSEYQAENGVARATATEVIRRLAAAGKIRPVRFSVQSSNGVWQTRGGWQLVEEK